MTTSMTELGTLLGGKYTIYSVSNLEGIGYIIEGRRGATYGLMRNYYHPEQLFAVNANRPTSKTPFDGHWFVERDGWLESDYGRWEI